MEPENGTLVRRTVRLLPMPSTPVEQVFSLVRESDAGVNVERLTVSHPGDDDNVWWLWTGPEQRPAGQRSVQIDTGPGGAPPFLVEGDDPDQRLETSDAAVAADAIIRWTRASFGSSLTAPLGRVRAQRHDPLVKKVAECFDAGHVWSIEGNLPDRAVGQCLPVEPALGQRSPAWQWFGG